MLGTTNLAEPQRKNLVRETKGKWHWKVNHWFSEQLDNIDKIFDNLERKKNHGK